MDYQKAIGVLKSLPEKYPLVAEEKEAISIAMGVLTLAAQSMSRVKAMKDKKSKNAKW